MGCLTTVSDFRVIIPFQLRDGRLVKTHRFREPTYLGDPRIMARIYRELRADQILIVDLSPAARRHGPDFALLDDLLSELPLPVAYGGGIRSRADAQALIHRGIDHLVFASGLWDAPQLIRDIAADHGRQAVLACLDHHEGHCTGGTLAEGLRRAEHLGAGEVLLQSMTQDGTRRGFDLERSSALIAHTTLPVLIGGGAAGPADLRRARTAGFAGALAGACAFFQGDRRAILPWYPRP